jgi:hypothetical protein
MDLRHEALRTDCAACGTQPGRARERARRASQVAIRQRHVPARHIDRGAGRLCQRRDRPERQAASPRRLAHGAGDTRQVGDIEDGYAWGGRHRITPAYADGLLSEQVRGLLYSTLNTYLSDDKAHDATY